MLRSALATLAALLVFAACSESGGEIVSDDRAGPAAVASAVAGEVHDALDVGDTIDVDDPIVEPCYDAIGRQTGEVSARVHSRAEPGVVAEDRFEALGDRLGATDVRRHDVRDPLDETRVIGQQQSLFAERDGLDVSVTMSLTEDGFTASVRTACP